MAMQDYCLKLQISQGSINQDDGVSDPVFLLLLACVMVNQICQFDVDANLFLTSQKTAVYK